MRRNLQFILLWSSILLLLQLFQLPLQANTLLDDYSVVSGYVFIDLDGDCVMDAGESGVQGVDITVYGPDGYKLVIQTDANGYYIFPDLESGMYSVSIGEGPDGYVLWSSGIIPVSLDSDEVIEGVNFCYGDASGLTTIEGCVYADENCNGIKDVGENGIEGVVVYLYDDAGNIIEVLNSSANGNYAFAPTPSGQYEVVVGNGPDNFSLCSIPSYPVNLAAGETFDAAYFGFESLIDFSSIDGYVFIDLDGDCVLGAGESGVQGVDITIYGPDGYKVVIQTDANGYYIFPDLEAGIYSVVIGEGPDGYVLWSSGTIPVSLDSDEVIEGVNFCYGDTSGFITIEGCVYVDENCNSIRDEGEGGIEGIVVYLYDDAGNILEVLNSAANGNYTFASVPAGQYEVVVGNGPDNFSLCTVSSYPVNLLAGNDFSGAYFGFGPPSDLGSIHGYVHECGMPYGTTGFGGIQVSIFAPDGSKHITYTNADGTFHFPNLEGGAYSVVVGETPDGYMLDGSATYLIIIEDGETYTDVLFCFSHEDELGSIGDYVWLDINGDGIQDVGEPPLDGITVFLYDEFQNIVEIQSTDENGYYLFENLEAGDYTVVVGNGPYLYELTTQEAYEIALGMGDQYLDADFGFQPIQNDCENAMQCDEQQACVSPTGTTDLCVGDCIPGNFTITSYESMFQCGLQLLPGGCLGYTPIEGMDAIGYDYVYIEMLDDNDVCYQLTYYVLIGDCSTGCVATAGNLDAVAGTVCEGETITVNVTEYPVVPDGYEILYVLTDAQLNLIGASEFPYFSNLAIGNYNIHTLIYNPADITPNDYTNASDLNGILIQGGGDICAALLLQGAEFVVEDCTVECAANAGSLAPISETVCIGEAIAATIVDFPVAPSGTELIYVLVQNGQILDTNEAPHFFGLAAGSYSIHSLIYDSGVISLDGSLSVYEINDLFAAGECGALFLDGANFVVEDCTVGPQCTADAGLLQAIDGTVCLGESIVASIINSPIVPTDYELVFIFTDEQGTIIESTNVAQYIPGALGTFSIHSLVYNPSDVDIYDGNYSNLSDLLSLFGPDAYCGDLSAQGVDFIVEDCIVEPTCEAQAGSMSAIENIVCQGESIAATFIGYPTVPDFFQVEYLLVQDGNILSFNDITTFYDLTEGNYSILPFVYDPTEYTSGVATTVTELQSDIDGLCADLSVYGANFIVEDCVVTPECTTDAGSLIAIEATVCQGETIVASIGDYPVMPAGFDLLYLLTQNGDVLATSTVPYFTNLPIGAYNVHTLVYNPAELSLTDYTTAAELIAAINQPNICADLFAQGAGFVVEDCTVTPTCEANAGALVAIESVVCSGESIVASIVGYPYVPTGYELIYVLAEDGFVLDLDNTPFFTDLPIGNYSIHTLVYSLSDVDPASYATINGLEMAVTQPGVCGDFFMSGAEFVIEDCTVEPGCDVSAGSLTAIDSRVCEGESIVASIIDFPQVPAGYSLIYVLTENGNVSATASVPYFMDLPIGNYTIHSLVFDPLQISPSDYTSAAELNAAISQPNICADLLLEGADFTIEFCDIVIPPDPNCYANAGGLACDNHTVCEGEPLITYTQNEPYIPTGYEIYYLLVDHYSHDIIQMSNVSSFYDIGLGAYGVYSLVYNPAEFDLYSLGNFNELWDWLESDGVCADILSEGVYFEVIDCTIPVDCENEAIYECTQPLTPIIICPEFCQFTAGQEYELTELHATFDCGLEVVENCIRYTPLPAFEGEETITAIACYGGLCYEVLVHVTVGSCQDNNPPIATNNSTTTTEGVSVTIDVLSDDSDPDNDNIYICNETTDGQALNGTVVLSGGQFIYTPNAGFVGTDSFTYTICDGNGGTSQATVTIVVEPSDCYSEQDICILPFVQNQSPTLVCVEFCSTGIAITDIDMIFDCSVYQTNATCFEYTPLPQFTGANIVTVTGCNDYGHCETAIVNIEVGNCGQGGQNNPPIAVDDSATTTENQSVTISVLPNDSDPDNDIVYICNGPNDAMASNGSVSLVGSDFVYNPNPGFVGTDSFTYTICDGNGGSSQATVTITIVDDNCNPDQSLCVPTFESSQAATLICVDFCGNGMIIEDVSGLFDCGISITGSTCFEYTPLPQFFGANDLTVTACNSNGQCETAYVYVNVSDNCDGIEPPCQNDQTLCLPTFESNPTATLVCVDFCGTGMILEDVSGMFDCGLSITDNNCFEYTPLPQFIGPNDITATGCNAYGECETVIIYSTVTDNCGGNTGGNPPVAINDDAQTGHNTSVTINVLNNDYDPDGDNLFICNTSYDGIATNGTVNLSGSTFTYTPNNGFTGSDSFTYTICDGTGAYSTATVTIIVAGTGNTPPVAVNDYESSTGGASVTINVLGNDYDSDGDGIYVCYNNQSYASSGIVTFIGNGQFTYTPNDGFTGQDSFTYTLCDENGGTAIATVYINVEGEINYPPVAINDYVEVLSGASISIDVLGNDGDMDSNILTVCGFGQGANGTVVQNGNYLNYTPNPGYIGTDAFTYTVCDEHGNSDIATVYVTVLGTSGNNLAPYAVDDQATVACESYIYIDPLTNDYDPEGDEIYLCGFGTSAQGGSIQQVGTQLYYTPPTGGYTGSDQFTYTVCDVNGNSTTGTINVLVTCAPLPNSAPETAADYSSVECNGYVYIDVLLNDYDPDGDALTLCGVSEAMYGGAVQQVGTQLYYTPPAGDNINIIDEFWYTVCDSNGNSTTGSVYVTVNCSPPPPPPPPSNDVVANDDYVSGFDNEAIYINVLSNDSYPADCQPVITVITPDYAYNGTVLVTVENQLVYIPQLGSSGWVTIEYQICCGNNCDTATVTIDITPHGDCTIDGFRAENNTGNSTGFNVLENIENVEYADNTVVNTQSVNAGVVELKANNVFTPNGDGINDELTIIDTQIFENIDNVEKVEIMIFDLKGNQVFYSNDLNEVNTWNGTYNNDGTPAMEGTYFYRIVVEQTNGMQVSEGSIDLRR